jgi:hypothetical protein
MGNADLKLMVEQTNKVLALESENKRLRDMVEDFVLWWDVWNLASDPCEVPDPGLLDEARAFVKAERGYIEPTEDDVKKMGY